MGRSWARSWGARGVPFGVLWGSWGGLGHPPGLRYSPRRLPRIPLDSFRHLRGPKRRQSISRRLYSSYKRRAFRLFLSLSLSLSLSLPCLSLVPRGPGASWWFWILCMRGGFREASLDPPPPEEWRGRACRTKFRYLQM